MSVQKVQNMELASVAIALQQTSASNTIALSMLKQNAKTEQSLADMIATSSTVGTNLDINV
ncbi:MAG: hypothetical protein PW788_09680 [Micavibrio sp.]|nr:hypothetical protein [Micavibrio sp.]